MALLALLFLVVPFVEVYLIIQATHAIGGWPTLGLLVAFSVVGGWLMKREGRKVWQRFTDQINRGTVPTTEIADGVLLLVSGALMLTPGFLTDFIGLLGVFPPTRALFRKALVARFVRRHKLGDLFDGSTGVFKRARTIDTTVYEPSTRVDNPFDELGR